MSANWVLFRGLACNPELMAEPSPGTMDPNARRVPRAPKDRSDFPGVEAFPRDQSKKLALAVAQARKRLGGDLVTRRCDALLVRGRRLSPQPLDQALAAQLAAPLVGKDVTRGPVEPEPRRPAGRHLLEAAPGHEKGLGDHVTGIGGSNSPERVAENTVVVLLVESLEVIASRTRHARQR
jgi:hypothetical protein